MIELKENTLNFQFPEVHQDAVCSIKFERTLRIPDDNTPYSLPPGLGQFPVKHIDDYAENLPSEWAAHGGVFIPLYQSEALWLNFDGDYPCAVKIAAGKINAVDGSKWSKTLSTEDQDYVVIPEQPWLDGFNVSEGFIRQFVAMPLGEGYTAEEQITGKAEHGGLQIIVYPMKQSFYEKLKTKRDAVPEHVCFMMASPAAEYPMGLAPGGLMRQEIYDDDYGIDAWDQENGFKCFVHLVNSQVYGDITGTKPPHKPPSAKDYNDQGLPWFEYYSDSAAISGSQTLSGLSSIGAATIQKTGKPLADNEALTPLKVKSLGSTNIVRQGIF